MVPGVK